MSGACEKMTPPNAIVAEAALLGCAVLDAKTAELVDPAMFFDEKHRALSEAVQELHAERAPIDYVTLADRLRALGTFDLVGGMPGILAIGANVPSAANAAHYAGLVADAHRRRAIITAAERAIAGARSPETETAEVLSTHESALVALRPKTAGRGLRHVGEAIASSWKRLETLSERKSAVTGLSTGLDTLDDLTAGLQPADLIIIAGRPSMGKSALAVGIGQHAAINLGATVAVFSLEMSAESLAMRMIASEGRIEGARLRTGALDAEHWPRISRAAGAIAEARIYIDDTPGATIEHIERECDGLAEREGLHLIVVDYLQLAEASDKRLPREQVIAKNSRGLKALAKKYNVPVVALSQLNRSLEQRQDKRPVMSDLRESGAIEQDADVIAFIYRDVVYNPETEKPSQAEIIIGKQRSGPLGTAHVAFVGEYTRFENLAPDEKWQPRE